MIVTEYNCIRREDYEDEEEYMLELIDASNLHQMYGIDPDDVFAEGEYEAVLFEAYISSMLKTQEEALAEEALAGEDVGLFYRLVRGEIDSDGEQNRIGSKKDTDFLGQMMEEEKSDNQGNNNATITAIVHSINHLNYPDKRGYVYCRAKNKLIELNFEDCPRCPLLYGSIQGNCVECFYPDFVEKDSYMFAATVINPKEQLVHIKSLIDNDILPIDPTDPFTDEEFKCD